MKKLDPLIEEALAASVVMTLAGAAVAFFYWALTDLSPWPYVILSETAALGFGVVIIALTSPRRHG